MKPNLFMKRKLEIGLTLLIGMSAFGVATMTLPDTPKSSLTSRFE